MLYHHPKNVISFCDFSTPCTILQFVAHPHCQQLLSSIWYGGLPGFRRRHITYKILMTFVVCVLAPLCSILYMLAPKTKFGRLMRQPFIKFIVHSAFYCIFLCKFFLMHISVQVFTSYSLYKLFLHKFHITSNQPTADYSLFILAF